MIATFKKCSLRGTIDAPASKSMAHRYLIGAALSGQRCTLTGVDFNEDIYGQFVELEVYKFLRPIQKFSSLEEVQKQVKKDIEEAKQ